MEQLISFVMDHFFIVVIVIGLIYSMFFRKSPLEKRPPNRMPDFGGGPVFPQRPRRPGTPAGSPPDERQGPPPVERREPLPEYRQLPPSQPVRPLERPQPERPSWVPVEPAAMPAEDEAVSPTAAVSRGLPVAETAPETLDSTLTRDDLTRAIVWAEILGPPRSRRPFRRS